ncbi:MAG: hypothetical protein Ct9H90mP20_6480 [Candidatus Neomarinimicrobiota bacterium]|nr:MAG: hypothetical protein Ct9H90mP20_6480 [Candidatus Neomarinimicrobiota bacterium]
MVVPIFISYFTEGYDLFGFIYSSLICISIGTPIWFFTRHNKSLNNKVGFAVVTFSWIFPQLEFFTILFKRSYPKLTMLSLNQCLESPQLAKPIIGIL